MRRSCGRRRGVSDPPAGHIQEGATLVALRLLDDMVPTAIPHGAPPMSKYVMLSIRAGLGPGTTHPASSPTPLAGRALYQLLLGKDQSIVRALLRKVEPLVTRQRPRIWEDHKAKLTLRHQI